MGAVDKNLRHCPPPPRASHHFLAAIGVGIDIDVLEFDALSAQKCLRTMAEWTPVARIDFDFVHFPNPVFIGRLLSFGHVKISPLASVGLSELTCANAGTSPAVVLLARCGPVRVSAGAPVVIMSSSSTIRRAFILTGQGHGQVAGGLWSSGREWPELCRAIGLDLGH